MMRWISILVFCLSLVELACCQRLLGSYKVDRSKISVSGLSTGGAMATQMHVAYSSVFMGVGIIAGMPYYCARVNWTIGISDCMQNFDKIDIPTLVNQTRRYAKNGLIDPTRYMVNDRVYIFNGLNETVVLPGVGVKIKEYYETFVNSSNIMTVFNISAEHAFPTMNYGNPCGEMKKPWISRCEYDAAYELLQHIYGDLKRPTASTPLLGDFYKFRQTEFFYVSTPAASSMDDVGFVYVPSGCKSTTNTCRLHVALHGCYQGRWNLGEEYARNTGYNEVGELNNIIIIYPQTIVTKVINEYGCWDWWGYTDHFYATKNADQTLAVWRMVQKAAYSEINTDGKVTCACSVDKITNAFVVLSTFIMLINLT